MHIVINSTSDVVILVIQSGEHFHSTGDDLINLTSENHKKKDMIKCLMLP